MTRYFAKQRNYLFKIWFMYEESRIAVEPGGETSIGDAVWSNHTQSNRTHWLSFLGKLSPLNTDSIHKVTISLEIIYICPLKW